MTHRGLLTNLVLICVHLWLILLLCGCSQKPAEQATTTSGAAPSASGQKLEIAARGIYRLEGDLLWLSSTSRSGDQDRPRGGFSRFVSLAACPVSIHRTQI